MSTWRIVNRLVAADWVPCEIVSYFRCRSFCFLLEEKDFIFWGRKTYKFIAARYRYLCIMGIDG